MGPPFASSLVTPRPRWRARYANKRQRHGRGWQTPEEQQTYIKDMHLLKTGLFMKMIETGALPLRPGVAR